MEIRKSVSASDQIAAHYRKKIVDGEFPPGARLPGESTVAQEAGISRPVVNTAYRKLASEGLVDIVHGKGTFVRERRPLVLHAASYVTRNGGGTRAQWAEEMARQGLKGTQELREVTTTTPADDIAGWLVLQGDEEAVVRRRVMLIDEEPVELADSYYPARLAAGTELAERKKMRGGTVAALERLGSSIAYTDEILFARMPTEEEARLLELGPGVPVIRHVRVSYDGNDIPVEVSEAIARSDRHAFYFRLPAQA